MYYTGNDSFFTSYICHITNIDRGLPFNVQQHCVIPVSKAFLTLTQDDKNVSLVEFCSPHGVSERRLDLHTCCNADDLSSKTIATAEMKIH